MADPLPVSSSGQPKPMSQSDLLRSAIRDVPDFPKPGIIFKDITPVLADPLLFKQSILALCDPHRSHPPTKIVGIDARGFIFGAAMALELGCGFVPLRKSGKLPWKSRQVTYSLEYGEATIELHDDALDCSDRVLIVDDLLATGGTAKAAIQLVAESGAHILGLSVLVELAFLKPRESLASHPIWSVISFP